MADIGAQADRAASAASTLSTDEDAAQFDVSALETAGPASLDTTDRRGAATGTPDAPFDMTLAMAQTYAPAVPAATATAASDTQAPAASANPVLAQAGTALVSFLQTPQGNDHIVLHLTPEALGAVQVTVTRDADGNTTMTFAASEPETLHALAAGKDELHALARDAGLHNDTQHVRIEFTTQAITAATASDTANTSGFSTSSDSSGQNPIDGTRDLNGSFTSNEQNSETSGSATFGFGQSGEGASSGSYSRGRRSTTTSSGDGSAAPASHARGARVVLRVASGATRPINITV